MSSVIFKKTSSRPKEYLLVTDRDSRIIKASLDRYELIRLANIIRKSCGEVTIFKSTSM